MGKVITGSEPRALIPARTYLAVIVGVYDIGTTQGNYGPRSQWVLEFELHTRKGPCLDKDGEILKISQFVPAYLGNVAKPSDLLKAFQAAKGRFFTAEEIKAGVDIEELLEATVKVQVSHKPKTTGEMRAIVESVLPLDEDDDAPTVVSDSRYFEIKAGERRLPDWLPKFVRESIEKSDEFTGGKSAASGNGNGNGKATREPGDDDEDEIPY